jgi:WD40 repeat protein
VHLYPTPLSPVPELQPETVLRFSDEVWAIDFGASGNWFAAADLSGKLEVRQFDPERTLALGPVPRAMVVKFSPDERRLGVGSGDGRLWICELAHGRCDLLHSGQSAIHSLAFTPDSRMLFVAGGDALVYGWDLESREHRIYQGHRAPIFDLDIRPDGLGVLSASADETVRLWPVLTLPSQEALHPFLDQLTRQAVPETNGEGLSAPLE